MPDTLHLYLPSMEINLNKFETNQNKKKTYFHKVSSSSFSSPPPGVHPHFLPFPNGVLDFQGPEIHPPTPLPDPHFLPSPNGVLDFWDPQIHPPTPSSGPSK